MATEQVMALSDFNLEKLNTKEMSEHMNCTIQMGGSLICLGRRGGGKTAISRQQIESLKYHEAYINLSVLERVDLGGYPNVLDPNRKSRFIDFLLPRFYQCMIEGDKPVVALLDEADKADPSLWAPLLEFVQDRRINGHALPNLKAIIMTGNLLGEGGSKITPPLMDRAEKYIMEADVQNWLDWAGISGRIHPAISAYIYDNPSDLFGAVDPDDILADPSPRGWDGTSQICSFGEKAGWGKTVINKKVSGRVGKEAGIKYRNYYEYYVELLPLIGSIFNGENIMKQYEDLTPSKQMIACMIIFSRLANQLDQLEDEARLPNSVGYIGKFLKYVQPETALISIRSQIRGNRVAKFKLDDQPDWKHFIDSVKEQVQM